MYPLKQSTAITIPFFAHDVNGDGVTGLVDGGFTKRISKNGGAFAAMTVTITEMENGWYSLPVSTAHSDTLGALSISISHASIKRANLQFRVHARINDDYATPTNITAATGITVSALGANVITAASINAAALNGKGDWNVGKTGYSLTQSFPTNFASMAITVGGAVTAGTVSDKTGYALSGTQTFNNTGTWTGNLSGSVGSLTGHTPQTGDSFARIGATGSGLTSLASASNLATATGYIDTEIGDIQSRLPAALVGGRMDASVGAIAAGALTALADAVLDEVVDGVVTLRESIRLQNSASGGKASGLDLNAPVFRNLADTKDRITAVTDADGNRSSVTLDLT